jgi:hypothetical protein
VEECLNGETTHQRNLWENFKEIRSLPNYFDIVPETAEIAGYCLSIHRRFKQLSTVHDETRKYWEIVERQLGQ